MAIGTRVRERRKALRLSQEQLASQAGLTWSAIQRLEAGQVTDPHYSTLSSIAHVLGTTVAEMVGEKPAVPLAPASRESGQPEAEASQETGLIRRPVHDEVPVADSVKPTIFGHLDALEAALKTHGLNGELLDMVDEMRKRVAA